MFILKNICCILLKIKGLINATTWWKPLYVTYLQHKSVSKGEGVRFFQKIILSENNFFAIDYQENTTICLLQLKILGRNYLCTNNRCIIFVRFIILNNTVHHFCKNLYLKYTMQKKATFTLNSDFICFVDIREVLLTIACMNQIKVSPIIVLK